MKAKIIRGKSFRGVLRYVLDEGPQPKGKKPSVVSGNIIGFNSHKLTQGFQAVRALRPDINKAVWHCPLSAAPNEHLSDEQWDAVTKEFLKKMGLDDFPYVAVRHNDTDHDHVHIVVCRINEDSKIWVGEHELFTAIEATQKIEQEFGLVRTQGLKKSQKKRPSGKEINKAIRTGQEPPRTKLQRIIDEALQDAPTGTEFLHRLEAAGVEVKANTNSKGVNGLSFAIDGLAFSGSKLGTDYKWSSLLKRGLSYEQTRDFGAFEGRRAVREDASVSVPNRGDLPGVDRVEEPSSPASERAGRAAEILDQHDDEIRIKTQPANPRNRSPERTNPAALDWDNWGFGPDNSDHRRSPHDVTLSAIVHEKRTTDSQHPGVVNPDFAVTRFSSKSLSKIKTPNNHSGVVHPNFAATRFSSESLHNIKTPLDGTGPHDVTLSAIVHEKRTTDSQHPGVVPPDFAATRFSSESLHNIKTPLGDEPRPEPQRKKPELEPEIFPRPSARKVAAACLAVSAMDQEIKISQPGLRDFVLWEHREHREHTFADAPTSQPIDHHQAEVLVSMAEEVDNYADDFEPCDVPEVSQGFTPWDTGMGW